MQETTRIVDREFVTLQYVDEDIILISFPHPIKLDLEAARIVIAGVEEITHGNAHSAIVDLRNIKSMSRDARKYFADGTDLTAEVYGNALITNNSVERLLGNFFMGLNKPKKFPIRLFDSRKTALKWIKTSVLPTLHIHQ